MAFKQILKGRISDNNDDGNDNCRSHQPAQKLLGLGRKTFRSRQKHRLVSCSSPILFVFITILLCSVLLGM